MPTSNHSQIKDPEGKSYLGNEIDLRALINEVWRGRGVVLLITCLTTLSFTGVALLLPNLYTSTALLAPAAESDNGIGAAMKQYGGLASLAGVTLPAEQGDARAKMAIELLKSRAFLGEFVERREILPDLMAVKSWNMSTGVIEYDSELYDSLTDTWVREEDPPLGAEPSLLELHESFGEILNISEDPVTGYYYVSISHRSPLVASNWVNWLIEDINAVMRAKEIDKTARSISFLQQQVEQTQLAELQAVFFELIQSQTETLMLARVQSDYVFEVVDPAVPAERLSSPNRLLISGSGFGLGVTLAFMVILVRRALR